MMKPSFVTRVQRRVVNYEQLLRDLGVEEGSWGAYRRNVKVKEGVIGKYTKKDSYETVFRLVMGYSVSIMKKRSVGFIVNYCI